VKDHEELLRQPVESIYGSLTTPYKESPNRRPTYTRKPSHPTAPLRKQNPEIEDWVFGFELALFVRGFRSSVYGGAWQSLFSCWLFSCCIYPFSLPKRLRKRLVNCFKDRKGLNWIIQVQSLTWVSHTRINTEHALLWTFFRLSRYL